ncbi:hypothetical protein KUTeg_011788 [Tegillarca granosa]|uniref:Uncharacterized protein n=1 Tax=Tegillarca granosa TaxID=220873 RepID=A0ABQ9EXN8_TEGGR|nr:hypothetical protein KUTeg_011788 [Tegillarca granosa]
MVLLRKGCTRRLRLDHGTENSYISQMQMFLRYGHQNEDAQRSVIYTAQATTINFWMNLFQTQKDEGYFTGDILDKNIFQFCFMQMIQDELDRIVEMWNAHRIRPYRNRNIQCGRPMVMYNLPHLYRRQPQNCTVSNLQIELCENECSPNSCYPCDDTVFELCCMLMMDENYSVPSSPEEALLLYHFLRNSIRMAI